MTLLMGLVLLTGHAGLESGTQCEVGVAPELASLTEAFARPPVDCRPHTRWWWMGNALREEDITFQLEQMHARGMGGVEQITMDTVYEKGSVPYLSDRWFELITHAIREAKRLGMRVSLNFGGPGWVIGGDWTPPEDRSQNLLPTSMEITGPVVFEGPLPLVPEDIHGEIAPTPITPSDRLVAVMAGRMDEGGHLEPASLIDISSLFAQSAAQRWNVPEGHWKIMAFWLKRTMQGNALDHFNHSAMEHYCEYLGGRFREYFGDEFGKTVESFFCDSFEVAMIGNSIYWSDDLLESFKAFKGYDLKPLLPAVWWEVGELSPKVRYDVNHFLHHEGLEAFFKPFLSWCERNGVEGRIQPYGFTTDILEGAGMTHLPEMEITAGEKDAVPWFDTRIGPKKYVASGAHLYGRNIVTVEAYTYIHWEPYRETLEELKIASDIFLRSGANRFYNHGYVATPERDIAPTRGFYSGARINHESVWWPHYGALADYVGRACYLLRQGQFKADIALYSPLANQWTKDVRNARKWTRSFDWGGLGGLLLANGYDFDLINDDVLQNRVRMDGGTLYAGEMAYRILILPNIESMPLASLERMAEYVRGGGVAIALERIPEQSVGLADYAANDARLKALADALFVAPKGREAMARNACGAGWTYQINQVMDRTNWLDLHASALDPFLNTLRRHCPPDFDIDFTGMAIRENRGLAFMHRTMPERDIYFITNVQEIPVDMRVKFHVADGHPWQWNPYDGTVKPLYEYAHGDGHTSVPVRLAPFASTFYVFERTPATPNRYAAWSDFDAVEETTEDGLVALTDHNGLHQAQAPDGSLARVAVDNALVPLRLTGSWKLVLESPHFTRIEKTLHTLECWTADPATKYFSGTGVYTLEYDLPAEYTQDDLELWLDLGTVGHVAEVFVNGRRAGLSWVRGQQICLTGYTQPGLNTFEIRVTNSTINRISGLSAFPRVPEELRPYFGEGKNDSERAAPNLIGFEPLPRSGLLGPVEIRALRRVYALWE